MFGNVQSKSTVRKINVVVPAPQQKPQSLRPVQARISGTTKTGRSPLSSPRPSDRKQSSTPQPRPPKPEKSRTPQPHVKSRDESLIKKAVKRKASTPPPIFDSSSDSDNDAPNSEVSFDSARKRIRSSASSVDPGRTLVDTSRRSVFDKGAYPLAHAADLVSGVEASKYQPAFREEIATALELQYPSESQRERFYLADSTETDGYKSLDDIRETIKFVVSNYLPDQEAETHTDDGSGFERRLIRAFNNGSVPDYCKVVEEYNQLIEKRVDDGTIAKVLARKHGLTFDWMKRILDQVYSRTVSPHVDSLKEYKNGTDNVYGELLYPLASEMFRETQLQSNQVFVDLGSGVGNVVLQAALEIGCESWGCEMMPNPCDLAELQAEEFPQRARLWGISVGEVHLLRGDFLENKVIGEVLKRADVVLVNNQAFGPDLNSKLVDRFLDLKDGCQVISLKSFKPEGFEIQERNVNDVRHLLKVRKLEYFSNRVSWTDAPGHYYIARKDPTDLQRFLERQARRVKR